VSNNFTSKITILKTLVYVIWVRNCMRAALWSVRGTEPLLPDYYWGLECALLRTTPTTATHASLLHPVSRLPLNPQSPQILRPYPALAPAAASLSQPPSSAPTTLPSRLVRLFKRLNGHNLRQCKHEHHKHRDSSYSSCSATLYNPPLHSIVSAAVLYTDLSFP
jgi:hypothetical protein